MHTIDQKRVDIQRNRIDACETLIDHILDDLPHSEQQPLLDLLLKKQADLEDEKRMTETVSRKLGAQVILRCWRRNPKTGIDTPVFDVPFTLRNQAEKLGLCVQ